MRILAVESSSDISSACIVEDDLILSNVEHMRKRDYSASLISIIKIALNTAGLTLNDLDGFAVGIGPGSFTGLRIAVTTIKGFNLTLGKRVVGIPSLDAIALNGVYFNGKICPIVDAKKNQIYACIYDNKGDKIKRASGYLLTTIEKVIPKLKEPTLFMGDGINLYRDLLEKEKKIFNIAERIFWYPRAYNIAKLALERFKKRDFDDADKLIPMYIYSKYCTITKPKKK